LKILKRGPRKDFFFIQKTRLMTLTSNNRWAASGAIAGAALIIYSPLTYWFMDTLGMGRGYVAQNKGTCPTYLGLFIHTLVLFFVVFGLLSINWACA
jgi:hypothetical protein